MGCAHCGSTLLTRVLARHSQIATVGELKMSAIPDYRDYRCGCGEELLECPFWKDVFKECAKEGVALDFSCFGTHYRSGTWEAARLVRAQVRGPLFERLRKAGLKHLPTAKSALSHTNKVNRVVIDKICGILQKPVFLDESKDPSRLMHLQQSGDYDIRAIYLVRDGRAVVASYMKRTPDIHRSLDLWENKVRECENLRNALPELKFSEIRFEDFCQNPESTLGEIFTFCGVDDQTERCMNLIGNPPQHIIGHASRLLGDRTIELRTEWPEILSAPDLREFERRGIDLNQKYRYESDAMVV